MSVRQGTNGFLIDGNGNTIAVRNWMLETKDPRRHSLLPPDFPPDGIDTAEGCRIAADWWEDAGNEFNASILRSFADGMEEDAEPPKVVQNPTDTIVK